VDSDYLFGNFLQLPAFRSSFFVYLPARYPSPFSAELPDSLSVLFKSFAQRMIAASVC
jgi:hypothetical protein